MNDIFSRTVAPGVEQRIVEQVSVRISQTRVRHARIRGAFNSVVAIVAAIGFVPTIQYVSTQAYASGFSGYASLFISDTAYAFANLKTMLLSLAESVPIFGVAFALGILIVFGISLRHVARATIALRTNVRHAHALA